MSGDDGYRVDVGIAMIKYSKNVEEYFEHDFNGLNEDALNDEWHTTDAIHRELNKYDTMFKIALGVKKLHKNGISHFDLKEANIFMADKFTPVLGDLGFTMQYD